MDVRVGRLVGNNVVRDQLTTRSLLSGFCKKHYIEWLSMSAFFVSVFMAYKWIGKKQWEQKSVSSSRRSLLNLPWHSGTSVTGKKIKKTKTTPKPCEMAPPSNNYQVSVPQVETSPPQPLILSLLNQEGNLIEQQVIEKFAESQIGEEILLFIANPINPYHSRYA